jgi:hypothetical protein
MWFPERDAAKEKRRREALAFQRRRRIVDMAGEIVIERDRDGKTLAAPPTSHGVQEFSCRDHLVVAPEMT